MSEWKRFRRQINGGPCAGIACECGWWGVYVDDRTKFAKETRRAIFKKARDHRPGLFAPMSENRGSR